MNKTIEKIKSIYKNIYKGFLFIASIAILIYLFPREGKFRYEFQKGRPWMHEVLFAPFDFPVYKSEAELQMERDSILQEFKPYFTYDSGIYKLQVQHLVDAFNRKWAQKNEALEENRNAKLPQAHKSRDLELITDIMEFVYSRGIVDSPEILRNAREQNSGIMILTGNVAEEFSSDNVLTLKQAYNYMLDRIKSTVESDTFRVMKSEAGLIENLNINEFLYPNLFYDEVTSIRAKEELIADLSLTKGMVQAGERIISKGELVNSEYYLILESLKKEYEKKLGGSADFYLIIVGQFLLVFASVLVLFLFLQNFRKEILEHSLKSTFILLLVISIAFLASMIIRHSDISLYVIPFAVLPIIIKTFYDSRLALFIHMITLLLIAFWAPNSFEFFFLNIIAGVVAIFSLTNLYRRSKLFTTAVLIFISLSFVYMGIALIKEGSLESIDYTQFIWFGGNGLLVLTSYPLIYIFEKTFGFLSDATLIELSDTNQELLRKLAEKAPGTFQHSLQVANLAEEAIFHTGGNPLLVRTGALYHDIGKMEDPVYFVENQTTDINPHKDLEFEQSAEIIINHVKKGVEIAKKYKLPPQIIDFIRTHHGTTAVQYFYKSYLKKYPEKSADIKKFSYPGPKPFSKEMAVLMMADSVEAASRSLKIASEESINDLVESIISYQIIEEQFTEADVTFKDITTIKRLFKRKLLNIYHVRIEYPK